jgi:hypothetical protein
MKPACDVGVTMDRKIMLYVFLNVIIQLQGCIYTPDYERRHHHDRDWHEHEHEEPESGVDVRIRS